MKQLILAALYTAFVVSAADDPNLAAFHKNLAAYMKFQAAAKASMAMLPTKASPEQIQKSEQSLAAAIIAQRPTAKMGDVFTDSAQASFRAILTAELTGSSKRANRQVAHQGDPSTDKEGGASPELAVNAVYPHSAPSSSIPPKLLARLPRLPEGIQYRFVGSNLLLVDTSSNVIIDFMKEVPGL